MAGYIGTQPVPQATQTRDSFTATAGQTSFATGGYTPHFLDVYLNGIFLNNGSDYTAGNGSDVVLTTGASSGDILEVVAYTTFEVADTYTQAEANPRFVPSGAVFMFAADAAPTGYLKANGATISRTTYAALFSVIGTTFGVGDGSTTFQLPDLRGEFLRGWDDSRGVDSGRAFGSAQGFGIPRLLGGVTDSHGNSAMTAANVSGYTNPFYGSGSTPWRTTIHAVTSNYQAVYFDSNRVIPIAPDVRPRNVALLACIKY